MTTIGIVAVIVTCVQYIIEKKNRAEDNEFHRTELTVQLLDKFAKEIIPTINTHYRDVEKEFESVDMRNVDLEKRKQILINVKTKHCIVDIFNSLEHVSVYIKTGIANNELLYDPISNVVIKFVEENIEVYEELIKRSPYKNLKYVLETWTNEKRLEQLTTQKRRIEEEEKAINTMGKKNL